MKLFVMCASKNFQRSATPFQKGVTANMRAFVSAKCAANDFFKESFEKNHYVLQLFVRKKS